MDAIDWAWLRHHYGRACDVPRLLRGCADPDSDTAAEALDELSNHLYHQGGWICSASSAALPFLVRLAADPRVRHRVEIIALIDSIAREAGRVRPDLVDDGWPETFGANTSALLDLLADPDPAVRRTSIPVTRGLPAPPVAVALLERWHIELDPVIRQELALALDNVAGRLPQRRTGPVPGAGELRAELSAHGWPG